MAPKRMVSLRLPSSVLAAVDREAARAGVTRTDWIGRQVARAALTAAGNPQVPHSEGDNPDGSGLVP